MLTQPSSCLRTATRSYFVLRFGLSDTSRRTAAPGSSSSPAPPGVFDMDGFHCAVHIYMGNKTVGAVKKNAVHDLSVFQCLLHFHFCLIRLRQNHWLHAKTGSCKRQPLAGARLFLTASSSTDHAGCSRRRPPPAFRCPAQTPPWVPDRGRGSGAVRRFRSPQRATGCGAHPP